MDTQIGNEPRFNIEAGTWANGTWANGTWANGTWANGTWANSMVAPHSETQKMKGQLPVIEGITWGNITWGNITWGNITWGNITWGNALWNNAAVASATARSNHGAVKLQAAAGKNSLRQLARARGEVVVTMMH